MDRRAILAAPALLPAMTALMGRSAQAQAPQIVTEEFMVPTGDAGIELFLRNKRPETMTRFTPGRTLLMVHGATYPASTAFDLPLGGLSWMDYIAGRGFDVWILDLRGYGRSTRPPEMSQPPEANPPLVRGEQAVADIAAASRFIREKRSLQKFQHMGYSWGTALMGRFAAENPNLVERLTLYAPVWLRQSASLADPGGELGAYRWVTQAQARARRGQGVPEAARAGLVPAGWFEHWAGVTWATDPEGLRRIPNAIRAPNGSVADGREFWAAGRPFYEPEKITAPTLLVLGEWDQDTPPYMAQTLFPLLTRSPGKRLVMLGEGTHSMWMERNRGALYQAIQVFLEEAPAG
ncbi:alpha/beta fold hydrolase [Rhodovarius crocodyli]|uniref:Alpha/beta fold hydrolase n=1 Tax=Rhodovarius crocodyli TaxID=1979269 RepID=A0A437MMK2_9PROT|nr:alpha/beta fold hydrolase [Rhodovarius crocodyli]RVT98884.1 alpha/beta fold hydrolase [Rhodovarius crocodyli]